MYATVSIILFLLYGLLVAYVVTTIKISMPHLRKTILHKKTPESKTPIKIARRDTSVGFDFLSNLNILINAFIHLSVINKCLK